MQVFNNKDNSQYQNSKPTCSYCRDPHHRSTDCPHVASDWAMFQNFQIPCSDPNHWTHNPVASTDRGWNTQSNTARWYMEPSGWSKWYAECEKAFHRQEQAKKRKAQSGTTRRQSRCGFCGSLHHNRRQCPEMTAMLDRLVSANQKWRQRFYDKFVTDLGLSVGAVVKVKQERSWNTDEKELIGIITSVNWDELSMFCDHNDRGGWNQRVDDKFRQHLRIQVSVDGSTQTLSFKKSNTSGRSRGQLTDNQGVLCDTFGWSNVEYLETIARSETPLDEEWVNQAYRESLLFAVKKYSSEKLTNWNVIRLLEIHENA
jgi:hypothetical protein